MLNTLECLNHEHRVAANDAHAHCMGRGILSVLDRIVNHQIHERVKPTEHAFYFATLKFTLESCKFFRKSTSVDLDGELLVHEFFQLWRVGLLFAVVSKSSKI